MRPRPMIGIKFWMLEWMRLVRTGMGWISSTLSLILQLTGVIINSFQ